MSYDPNNPFAGPVEDNPMVIPEVEAQKLWERFGGTVRVFFEQFPQFEWVALGDQSEKVIKYGLDADYPSRDTFDQWQTEAAETLHIFGPPIVIS